MIKNFFGFCFPYFFPDESLEILSGPDDKVEDDNTEDLPDEKDEDKDADESDKDGEDGEEGDDDKEDDEEEEKDDKDESEEEDTEEELEGKVLTSWTDIKKKYPDFGKDFPDVKNALFREQQFTEAFADPNDAKDAAEQIATFNQISSDVVGKGNIIDLLKQVETSNKNSYEKIIYSILPHLQESNKDLYYDIVARPIKQLLRSAWVKGEGSKTDLGKAAYHIHKFFFNDDKFDDKVKAEGNIEKETKTTKEKELEEKLSRLEQGEENKFLNSVDDSYVGKMKSYVRDGLDKDERLTEWTKSKITDDVLREISTQLKKDTRYTGTLSSLIKQARNNGFTNDFKSRIINTALARAKSLVPEVRKRIVGEVLKTGKKKEGNKEDNKPREKREFKKPSSDNNSQKKPQTDMDILRS